MSKGVYEHYCNMCGSRWTAPGRVSRCQQCRHWAYTTPPDERLIAAIDAEWVDLWMCCESSGLVCWDDWVFMGSHEATP